MPDRVDSSIQTRTAASRRLLSAVALALALTLAGAAARGQQSGAAPGALPGADVRPPEPAAEAPQAVPPPGPAHLWRSIRRGLPGEVSGQDANAAVLIQPGSEPWRRTAIGPVQTFGTWLLLLVFVGLAGAFVAWGRTPVRGRATRRRVPRLSKVQRVAHWLTALSFLALALTGLNLIYGRYVLLPALGPEWFAWVATIGKHVHSFIAVAFFAGLLLTAVSWLRVSLPGRSDLNWLARLGGLWGDKPRAGGKLSTLQKLNYWFFMTGGGLMAASGVALMLPFFFADMAGMQFIQIGHSLLGLIVVAVALVHMYLGSVAVEGALDAIVRGSVSEAWARQHYQAWFEDEASSVVTNIAVEHEIEEVVVRHTAPRPAKAR